MADDDGLPWRTGLPALRRAQREWLRSLPSWRLDRRAIDLVPDYDQAHDDAALIEIMLRLHAEELRGRIEADFSDLPAEATAAVSGWVRGALDVVHGFNPLADSVSEVSNRASRVASSRQDQISEEDWRPTLAAVGFCVWADDLADDGYMDPRIRAARSRPQP